MCTMLYVAVETSWTAATSEILSRSFGVRAVDEPDVRGVFEAGTDILRVDAGYCACGLLFRKHVKGTQQPRPAREHAARVPDARQQGPAPTADTLRLMLADIVRMTGRASIFTHEAHEAAEVRDVVRATLDDLERRTVGLEDGTLLVVARYGWQLEH